MAGFIRSPAKAFQQNAENLKTAFVYMALFLIISPAIEGVMSFYSKGIESAIIAFFASYMSMFLGVLISVVWLHLWVRLYKVRGLKKTFRIVCYGSTPSYLFSWLGLFNEFIVLAVILWTFLLFGIGLKEVHKMPPKRAAIAAILALIVGFILYSALVFIILFYYLPWMFSVAAQ